MATKRLMGKRNAAPAQPQMSEEDVIRQNIAKTDYTPKGLKGTYNEWNARVNAYFGGENTPKIAAIADLQKRRVKQESAPFLERTSTPAAQRAPGSGARALMPVSKPQTSGIQDVNGGKWKGSFFYGEDE
jgi:hypothetical protein